MYVMQRQAGDHDVCGRAESEQAYFDDGIADV
jgi:hypothetical protein